MTKCSKCGGTTLQLVEYHAGKGMYFQQTDGKIADRGDWKFEGRPYQVEATCCRCGHVWIVRGVDSVADMIAKAAARVQKGHM